jgi:hypothetical protein
MEAGEQAFKGRRWREAVASFTAAAAAWEPGRARAEARVKDARAAEAQDAARVTKPPPAKKLDGDLLVLVLRTPTSSLADKDFRAGLRGLEDGLGRKGTLLGGKVWLLDTGGPRPWDPDAEYPASAALDNRDFARLVEAIKAATAKLDARAVRPQFRVVVVWETDNKIDKAIRLPDRRYRLAYRYTLGDEEIAHLADSFEVASRFRLPGTVQKEVIYVASMKAPGGTP